jgi:hypothetical protein
MPLSRSAAVSKTSRSSFAKPACWYTPDAAELFNVLRLVLRTQPRSAPFRPAKTRALPNQLQQTAMSKNDDKKVGEG